MKKIALVAFLIAAAGLTAWYVLPRNVPQARIVETWVKGRGMGAAIKLFASGRYESAAFCDICPPGVKTGTWRESAHAVVLVPEKGLPVSLNKVTFRGCRALVAQGAPAPRFPTNVFFPASESCGDAL